MHRVLTTLTLVGLVSTIGGIGVLLAYATSEVLADRSLTLEDAYWIGRLPWTPIGVGLIVAGATTAVAVGAVTAVIDGGWIRRLVAIMAAGVAVFWWLVATVPLVGMGGAWCGQPSCPAPCFDVVTIAYSTPKMTVVWLLIPAVVAAAAALAPRPRPRSD